MSDHPTSGGEEWTLPIAIRGGNIIGQASAAEPSAVFSKAPKGNGIGAMGSKNPRTY